MSRIDMPVFMVRNSDGHRIYKIRAATIEDARGVMESANAEGRDAWFVGVTLEPFDVDDPANAHANRFIHFLKLTPRRKRA